MLIIADYNDRGNHVVAKTGTIEEQVELIRADEELIEIIKKENWSNKNIKDKILLYEQETGKRAVWLERVTSSFKSWLQGEKIYEREKKRISFYVEESIEEKWQQFKEERNYPTLSKLIRDAVNKFIDQESGQSGDENGIDLEKLKLITHKLKQPLTSIKGFAELLLEGNKDSLNEEVLNHIKNIYDQSSILEEKIRNITSDLTHKKKKIEILLIEDDQATIQLLETFFKSNGYRLIGAQTGKQGLEELEHLEPKIILIDVILPDIDGYDICKRIRTNETLKDVRIFYITAIQESDVAKHVAETRANGYFLKPFYFTELKRLFEYL